MTNGDESAIWTTDTDNVNSVNNVSSKMRLVENYKETPPPPPTGKEENIISFLFLTRRSVDGIGKTSKRCFH